MVKQELYDPENHNSEGRVTRSMLKRNGVPSMNASIPSSLKPKQMKNIMPIMNNQEKYKFNQTKLKRKYVRKIKQPEMLIPNTVTVWCFVDGQRVGVSPEFLDRKQTVKFISERKIITIDVKINPMTENDNVPSSQEIRADNTHRLSTLASVKEENIKPEPEFKSDNTSNITDLDYLNMSSDED